MHNVGEIIIVTYNNRIQPAIVSRQEPNNEVLVTFINPDVINSEINYREQFGSNILLVQNADGYIHMNLEDVFNYSFYNNLDDLQYRYNDLME